MNYVKPFTSNQVVSIHFTFTITTPFIIHNASWFMDLGAIDRITFDPTQLVNSSLYQGSNQLQVGNGENLIISHTSQLFFLNLFHIKSYTLKMFYEFLK